MRYFFFIILWLGFFAAAGQSGNYFLAHYSPNKDKFHNVCFDMIQDDRGIIYFATRSGILKFDGRDWEVISSSGAVYTLQLDKSGVLYWGGASGFGLVQNNQQGLPKMITLSRGMKDVIQSVASNGKLYFVNDDRLFIITPGDENVTLLKSTRLTGSFNGIFELFGVVHINAEHGTYKLSNGSLVRSTLPLEEGQQIIFSSSFKNNYLLGVSNNRLFTCGEDLLFREVKLEDSEYAEKSVIVNGKWLNRELFALGTLRGGIMFIHAPSGKTQEIINYATGLPDNEVFALLNDKNQCIWAAHEYGFTRVAPYLPFRSFNHYTGLQGNLLCARSYNNAVYVGTSLGLFKLEKENIYEEISYYVDVEVKVKSKVAAQQPVDEAKPTLDQEIATAEIESRKKGIFRFLRKNRKSKETDTQDAQSTDQPQSQKTAGPQPSTVTVVKPVLKTEKVLRSSHFVYKKVQGVDAKITQLIEMNGSLVAAGIGGTYEINGLTAKKIFDAPTRYLFASDKDILFIATYADQLKTFKNNGDTWKPLTVLQKLDDQINYIFDGFDNDIWLCALDKVYHLSLLDETVSDIQEIEIKNRNFDEFVGLRWKDQIILTNAEGFFHFDKKQRSFIPIDTLSSSLQVLNYFADKNRIWYRDLHSWNIFGNNLGETNLRLLNLFESIRYLSPDQAPENLWVITNSNELYKFFGERLTPYQSSFSILLKTIRHGDIKKTHQTKFKIDKENSAIAFEVVQPDYLASGAIEYRYILEGLDESWSDWSNTNNLIDFPYLPEGDYVLRFQSRDIFGKIQSMAPITFEVLPPYWNRPWFYALEVFVFAFLVAISFRLSSRYLIVSRILMLLTIILLIQFIQTVVGETFETRASPVVDFFVQVLIAILILPAEEYLRNRVMRAFDYPRLMYGMRPEKIPVPVNYEQPEKEENTEPVTPE